MMVAETRRFDFENSRSVKPNNTCMLCGRISDTGLYSFCYRRILHVLNVFGVQALCCFLLSERLSFTVQYNDATSVATCLAKPFRDKMLNLSLLRL